MHFPSQFWRSLVRLMVAWCALAGASVVLADMTWTPESGWRVEGGLQAIGIGNPEEASTALNLMHRARREQEVDNNGQALRLYRRVIRRYGTSLLAPEAHFQSGRIRIERRQWTHAFNHFQTIVDNHPDYARFGEVILHQYEIADALRRGARLRLFGVVPGFRSQERAVEYFEQVVENAPYSEVAPEALFRAARLQVRRGDLDEGIQLYDRLINEYPRHERTPDGYFGLAEAFSSRVRGPEYDQGATREAMSYYEDFAILHPQHPRAPEAEEGIQEMRDLLARSRVVIGDFYFFRRNNFHAARVFYNEAITISPTSPSAEEARQKLVRVERRAATREE